MKATRRMCLTVPMMALALFMSVSCTSDDMMENLVEQPTGEERAPKRAVMNLQGGVIPFDAAATRSESEDWTDGAKVYLQFTVGTSRIDGIAVYDADAVSWTVEYYGELAECGETKCEAYYFENTGEADHLGVALNEHSIIYADKAGAYMFEDNTLTVIANLVPMTGRIRFKGEAAETYTFTGIKHYTGYDIRTNSFTETQKEYNGTVPTDGYTPYYYGRFVDETKKTIAFDDNRHNMTYAKTLNENALAVGRSGCLNIPTLNSRSGWTVVSGEDFTVSGVKFRMVKVHKGTFSMGSTVDSNEKPVHSVTFSNSYLIGETEVTQELWLAVMGENPSYFSGDKKPVEKVSWNDCQSFITKLNAKTGRNFRLPTEAEWEFAARGGNLSKKYTYSGSNTIDDVAWYYVNSSENLSSSDANYGTHEVKTKQPNELGIYDMSGNVWEWCQDWYSSSYSSGSQTDPTGPTSGSYRVRRGGGWNVDATYCRVAYRHYSTPTNSYYCSGFRLALSN